MSRRSYLYVLLATLFFSSMEVALKGLVGHLGTVQVNCTRFAVGAVFLLPLAIRELHNRGARVRLQDLLCLAGLGFTGTVVSLTMYQVAVETIPANIVAVLFCCNTVFVLVMARIFLKTAVNRLQVCAVALVICGIIAVVEPWKTALPVHGLFFAVASPVFFAMYSVFATKACHRIGGISVTCGSFVFGSLEMLLLISFGHTEAGRALLSACGLELFAGVDLLAGYSPSIAVLMAYISIGITGLGFACYFLAAEAASPVFASLAFFVKPALAPLLAFVILGEPVTFAVGTGMIFVLAGSFLALLSQARAMKGVPGRSSRV